MREQGIIDPTKVVRTALIDASSVASLMLTTECMIYDEPEKKENKWSTKRWIWIWMIWITCIYWNNVYEANDINQNIMLAILILACNDIFLLLQKKLDII